MMKILKNKEEVKRFILKLQRRVLEPPEDILRAVKSIVEDVRKNGDRALLKYTKRFDGISLKTPLIPEKRIKEAARNVEKDLLRALRIAEERIRRFHERQKESPGLIRIMVQSLVR
jgi:histidinol dehydrogenase